MAKKLKPLLALVLSVFMSVSTLNNMYTVRADDMVPVPKDPVAEGKTFTGWADAEGNALDQNMTMTQDAAYYAVWN